MTIVALDWNATRALAVIGPAGDYALPVPLEPPSAELPMLLDLSGSAPVVGAPARRRSRVAPHQVCQGFLPFLGVSGKTAPTWRVGRRSLDSAQAVGNVWQRLYGLCRSAQGVVLTVPAYFHADQANHLAELGAKAKASVLGSLPISLAAALAAHAQQLWSRSAIVVDVDDHALTVALVLAGQDRAHLVETRMLPALGLRAWRDRLINALSDLCVWQTRRDPRDAPQAEQGICDQLDAIVDACSRQQPTQLAIQATQWYHHLLVQPGQTLAFCSPLASQAARAVEALGNLPPGDEAPPTVILTHAAGRLPGLRGLLTALAQAWLETADGLPARPRAASDDFGDDLLFETEHATIDTAPVNVLGPEAPARAAHGLADTLRKAEGMRPHLASVAPLPLAEPVEAGPARLHFDGRDYLLHDATFTLGSQAGCNLRLEASEHPEIAERQCDIVFDRHSYLLLNRSRQGTLVNDVPVSSSVALHAGDRIRLGAQGPVVRFLGRCPAPAPAYHTTA